MFVSAHEQECEQKGVDCQRIVAKLAAKNPFHRVYLDLAAKWREKEAGIAAVKWREATF
jgi:hypothetical protein